jgi:hypothetical protein
MNNCARLDQKALNATQVSMRMNEKELVERRGR